MNRYDKTAPSSSELSDPLISDPDIQSVNLVPVNLAKVRPGLTSLPQTILNDFKLYPTPYGLEIRLPLNRIHGSLMSLVETKADCDRESTLSLLAIAGMVSFVGGSVVLTGSVVFGVIVAVLLPALLWLIALSAKLEGGHEATLRLVNAPDGRTLLSLNSFPYKRSAKQVIYFSNRPVKLVSAKTTFSGGRVSFTVYTNDSRQGNQLHIAGNRHEVRWLHARIAHWGRGRVKGD